MGTAMDGRQYSSQILSGSKGGDINMNEYIDENGIISLHVVLPDNQVMVMDVQASTPMMDLLVSVASANKLKPGEHLIQAVSEKTGRTIEYKSSQTIGSLKVNQILLLSKTSQRKDRESKLQQQRDASRFEQTIRVTINLPRGVRSLQRLSPSQPIMQIFRKICEEKSLDPSRYEVRLTKMPSQRVDMGRTLNDYNTNEISIVQCKAPEFHSSMIDISHYQAARSDATNMADPFEKVKKKRSFFSFFRKDKSKSSNQPEPDTAENPKAWKKLEESRSQSVQALPQHGDIVLSRKPQAQVRPQPQVQPTITEENEDDIVRNKARRNPSKKKYKAPPPPSRPLSVMHPIAEEKRTPMYASTPNLTSEVPKSRRQPVNITNHSRNSSDSSGYHELPSDHSSPNNKTNSLPRDRAKQGDPVGVNKPRPVSAIVQRSQTLPSSVPKKKKAPVPPKKSTAPTPPILHNDIIESEEETASISSQSGDVSDMRPELGIGASTQPPPIFIPPPPPETPPPDAAEDMKEVTEFTRVTTDVPQYDRSESRCSRTSVNTIDDVQIGFDLAIEAGESQLRQEEDGGYTIEVGVMMDLTKEMEALTNQITESSPILSPREPTKQEVDEAVAALDLCVGDDDCSDSSLVPDGENYTEVLGSVRSTTSSIANKAKPIEEISYGFDNPFRGAVTPVEESLTRRDSQVSDSTLPDSEHTDRPQSSSLQSSGVQSDEESITETGYDTPGTEKTIQSETESHNEITPADLTDGPFVINQIVPKTENRGMFLEVKGNEINKAIYGDTEPPSLRGVPGQVKHRTSSFSPDKPVTGGVTNKTGVTRPKTIYGLLTGGSAPVGPIKRHTVDLSALQPDPDRLLKEDAESKPAFELPKETKAEMSTSLYTRPLPVYSRMNKTVKPSATSTATVKPVSTVATVTPTSAAPKPLGSVLSESIKTGETNKPLNRITPDGAPKPLFFKAARSGSSQELQSAVAPQTAVIPQGRIKLDSKYEKQASIEVLPPEPKKETVQPAVTSQQPETVSVEKPKASTLARRESLKQQYDKLQENMTKWQNKLKENENRMKQLTASQQNLATMELSSPQRPMARENMYQSVPSELNKVSLKSAAARVIKKPEPKLDPVETLMKSIRDRGGRTADNKPDRGIYVADGETLKSAPEEIAQREIAPSVANGIVPVPPPISMETKVDSKPKQNRMNDKRSNDPRFVKPVNPRDNLLSEIVNRKGKPGARRRVPDSSGMESSSQSSSDELRELEVRHKPHRKMTKTGKRSVSDPFPPNKPSNHQQPKSTQLDPREELMIAIRKSGGRCNLRTVKDDEIKWSAQV